VSWGSFSLTGDFRDAIIGSQEEEKVISHNISSLMFIVWQYKTIQAVL